MTYRLDVSRRAGRQIRAASTWWLANRDKAPTAFADDLRDAFNLLADLPGAGERVQHSRLKNARRLLMVRTQHHLYYEVDEGAQTVQILVLWHTSRRKDPSL